MSQFTDKSGRANLSDYIKDRNVRPAGRLDRDSEGLLVLTDDGKMQHKISHPANKMSKTYWVQVEGEPTELDLAQLREGIVLNDGPTLPCKAQVIATPSNLWPRNPPIRVRKSVADSWLSVSISEGRNRQVRRMCAQIGFPVLRLIRYRVGSWTLDGIAPGESVQK